MSDHECMSLRGYASEAPAIGPRFDFQTKTLNRALTILGFDTELVADNLPFPGWYFSAVMTFFVILLGGKRTCRSGCSHLIRNRNHTTFGDSISVAFGLHRQVGHRPYHFTYRVVIDAIPETILENSVM